MLFHPQHRGPSPRKIDISNVEQPQPENNELVINIVDPKKVTTQDINNSFKVETLKEIKKIDNSLTENDFDLSTKFNGVNTIDLTAKDNIIQLTIIGKNNATGQKVCNILVHQIKLFNMQGNIIDGDIQPPSSFKVANPKEVNLNDLYEGIKPSILSALKNEFKVDLKESDFIFTCHQPNFVDNRTTFDMSSPTQIEFNLDGRGWTLSGASGRTTGLILTMPSATKK